MTNEEYIKAIDMRRSRRSYKNKPLDPQIMDVIKEMVDAVNEIADLDFKFIEEIGLQEFLSPSRANGLMAMTKQIKFYAVAFQLKS